MASAEIPSELKQRFDAAGQDHVFAFWSKLDAEERSKFQAQLEALDVKRVNAVYKKALEGEAEAAALAQQRTSLAAPPASSTFSSAGSGSGASEASKYRRRGLEAIAAGQVGVLLLAGGQGTRLGSSAPKGCYNIGLPSRKSLFQLQAERIRKLEELAGKEARIPWFIMTSGPTRQPTIEFFQQNEYFGLKAEDVIFFEQGTLPCLTMEGKVMLASPSEIATAPDGNGGIYTALRAPLKGAGGAADGETVISTLQSRGVKYLHAFGVDNCLVKVGDPTFVGLCIERGVCAGVKTVVKTDPAESVGVVAQRNGKWGVIEYSEIPKELSEARDEDGQLSFRAANIVNHFYTTDFLAKEVPAFESEMAFHIARKKIPTIDLASGEAVKPSKPNGMKLELFIFDVFPFIKDLAVHEVARRSEFSPLKNAPNTGVDDPQTSRRDLLAEQRRWLESAGAKINDAADIEISPLVSYEGEGLESVNGKILDKSAIIDHI
ncbi:putative UDP-N-acetylglucosamine pyrophosphorylase [Ceraceosorus guamensis]|uniref:UDP-N-acetylglucosamine diphosphorylase n=1 Tax=Ceraceosorus guamensis TaxID=1522189 RepID=A0A316VZV0_9BASI|nr:putative UDP-N-acetylglucosamine pyrophosphorylase [Ceraceosorus guamensis]PWN41811.1 putative UDP-N-acetylglucosamine pyrophosphorylase [Ceraceosorus guamensis]